MMLRGFDPLTPAEQAVLAEVSYSGFTRIGDGALPPPEAPERVVRAALLRLVLTRADGMPLLHEKGLRLGGAIIAGPLDLEGCRIAADVRLADCRFEAALVLRSASLDSLLLDGSTLPGLLAEKLEARGGLYLRSVTIKGPVDFRGARLGGALVADGAVLVRPNDTALAADDIEARGGLLLRGADVRGVVALGGARLSGDLDVTGGSIANAGSDALRAEGLAVRGDVLLRRSNIEGRILLTGARIGGDVDLGGGAFAAPGGDALVLNRASVAGALMIREGATISGLLNLNGTSVDALVDAPESWPPPGDLALNRFLYKGFLSAPSDAAVRLDWLSRQSPHRWGEDFWPQPYEQLAAVLAESGHGVDARRVLVEKERLQRRARRARTRPWVKRGLLWITDSLLRITIGYGRRPLRAFLWLALLWLAGVALFTAVEDADALRPAPVVAVRSPEWVLCGAEANARLALPSLGDARPGLARPGESQLACWRRQPEAQAFTKFNAWMFALDTLLPGVNSGQTEAWAPDTRTSIGAAAKSVAHALTVLGWALGLLAVAGFSGIVRSD